MLATRVKLLLAAAAFTVAMAVGSISPAEAQACNGIPRQAPVVYSCNDPYSSATCFNTEPDPYSGICVDTTWRPDPIDPNNLCVDPNTCITGLEDNIQYVRDRVGELDDPVYGVLAYALGVVGGAVDDVNEILGQPICVQPFPPTTPICVT